MTDRANRVLWLIVGVLLLLVGLFGVLGGTGVLPGVNRHWHYLGSPLIDLWHDHRSLALLIAGVLGLIALVLGLWLAIRQLQPRRHLMADPIVEPRPRGATRIKAHALEKALQADLERHPEIRHASATFVDLADRTDVTLRLDVAETTDLYDLHDHVDTCLARLRLTYDLPAEQSEVTVNPITAKHRRVT